MPAVEHVQPFPRRDSDSSRLLRDDTGAPLRFLGVRRDSEGKRAKQVLRFLTGASAALDASDDFDALLHILASLSVPALGDWAIVDVADGNGRIQATTGVHVEPRASDLLVEALARRPAGAASSSLARAAIDSGDSHRA